MTLDEEDIFLSALQKTSAEDRVKFLDNACRGEPARRRAVERLLDAHANVDRFLGERAVLSPLPESATFEAPVLEGPGTQIGAYKLIELIGEGGMGVVFMADQQRPVRRKVALKIIKPGMDTRQVIARFEAERQALSLMDHPNIAKVLDAGATESGRPYFAMELIKGVPITKFCDERGLALQQRLELFVSVCQAIQHAHQKGVIHRDLKPSNVLIALYDGKPFPKVIDFGVAKAMGEPLTEKTLATGLGAVVGTLEYMSPEQAELNQLDIDTRSDIYSLGVLLYELLTGTTPLQKNRVRESALFDILRLVREEDPPRPSVRLSTTAEQASIAAARGIKLEKLSKVMRGELDWIVMKSLEKDRSRRYETASGLARDIERYLRDEPVEASPPGAGYRLQKFVKRNKPQVGAAVLILGALLAGVVGATWGMIRAEQARQDAVKAQIREGELAQRERRANEAAQKRLVQIEKGADILASVFRDLDPMSAERANATTLDLLRQRLVAAAQQLEGEAVGDPLVVARLQHVLGISLSELGHFEPAQTVLAKATRTREKILGANHLDTAASKHHLATQCRYLGDYALAERLYQEALEVRTAQLGAEDLDTADTKHHLAMVYSSQRKLDLAESLLKEVLAIRTARLGDDHPDTLTTQHRLAVVYHSQAKYALSEKLHLEVLAARTAKLGADHLDTVATKASLATLYSVQGKLDRADALQNEVLAVRFAKLGSDHPDTISSRRQLAKVYESQGNFEAAEPLFKEVLASRTAKLGADHPDTIACQHELASLYVHLKNYVAAETLYKELLASRTANLGVDHPATLATKNHLAELYKWQGKFALAEPLYKEVLANYTANLGADHPETLATKHHLAEMYQWQGRFDLAERLYKEVLAARTAKLGADDHETLTSQYVLATLYRWMSKLDQAIPLLEETLQRSKASGHPFVLQMQAELGAMCHDAGRYADAEPLLLNNYEELSQPEARALPQADAQRDGAIDQLIKLYDAWGKPAEASKWRQERETTRAAGKADQPNEPEADSLKDSLSEKCE